MSDLSDERLRQITLGPWHRKASQDDVDALVTELQRRRAHDGECARMLRESNTERSDLLREVIQLNHKVRGYEAAITADRERVRQVVGTAAMEELPADLVDNDACMRIADRCAEQLATPADAALDPARRNAIAALRNGTTLAEIAATLLDEFGEQLECPVHAGQVHGGEAEELRSGLEKLRADPPGSDPKSNREWCMAIQSMLDEVDARDSLAHIDRPVVRLSAEDREFLEKTRDLARTLRPSYADLLDRLLGGKP